MSHQTVARYMSLYNTFGGKSPHVDNLPTTGLRKASGRAELAARLDRAAW